MQYIIPINLINAVLVAKCVRIVTYSTRPRQAKRSEAKGP